MPNTPKNKEGTPYPESQINQPPYRTGQPFYDPIRAPGIIQSYWVNSDPNPVVQAWYAPNTNSIMNSAWLELDIWQHFPREEVCGDKFATLDELKAYLATQPPDLENAGRIFKLNDFTLLNPKVPIPFEGHVDAQGRVVPEALCGQEGVVCWPLLYTDGYPQQAATLHRGAEPGGCEAGDENPCIIFEFEVKLIFPPWDVVPGQEHEH
jgi:hypothetical protein